MKIAQVEAIPVLLEAVPFTTSYGTVGDYANVIVRITSDDGLVGVGEASPWLPIELGETQETVTLIVRRYLAPVLVGFDPFRVGVLTARMDQAILGHVVAKAAVDMALYDLIGKALGRPVYDLLGGSFRTSFLTFGAIGVKPPEEMVQDARAWVDGGHTTIKVKVPSVLEEPPLATVRRLTAIREAVGPEIRLIVDPNQGWISVGITIGIMRALDPTNLFVEQPIPRSDYAGMADIARAVPIPLIADESVFTESGLLQVIAWRAAHVVNIKLTRGGGFWKARRLINLAEAAGLQCQVDDVAATRITTTAVAHLACAVADPTFFGYSEGPAHKWLRRDIVARGGISIDRALVRVPDRPGLGVELDQDVLVDAAARATDS